MDSESLSYVFDLWIGFTEIDVDLLRFGWSWRRSRVTVVGDWYIGFRKL